MRKMAAVVISFALSSSVANSSYSLQNRSSPLQALQADILIQAGEVIDGTGSDAARLDVAIEGDRIVFVGNSAKTKITAARTIKAKGLVVAPGFIDPHTHSGADLLDSKRHTNLNYLMQGVTTVVVGNDGDGSPHPAAIFAKWEKQGIGTNAAILVGHGAVRREVLGVADVQPAPEQLEKMKSLVAGAMDEGAIGLSTGLFYVPGAFAKTEEIIELSKVAAARGGYYDSHMRDESAYTIGLLGSIEETIRIGREAHIPVHISHIKALGPQVWGKSSDAIAMINQARKSGVDVTADQYPYTASGSSLVASLMPKWAQILPVEQLMSVFADSGRHATLVNEIAENLAHRGGADSLLFTSSQAPELLGRTLANIADERRQTPVEAALGLITDAAQKKKLGTLAVASFNMNEQDIENFMRQDWVMTGSDGSPGHPRMYGTFPRKIREYVFNKKTITLPFAIHASSALTAETLRLKERGLLRPGYYADVIVFDPATIADRATYEHPQILAVGMKYVLVNGKLVIDQGQFTSTLAGRALRSIGRSQKSQ